MTDDPVMEVVCEECGVEFETQPCVSSLRERAEGEYPENESEPAYCPECGAEDPWVEQPAYDFEDVDLPLVFSTEHYDDHHGLWDDFCREAFGLGLYESNIANFPNTVPDMKYCVVELFYVLTEDYQLKGPFLDESEARKYT